MKTSRIWKYKKDVYAMFCELEKLDRTQFTERKCALFSLTYAQKYIPEAKKIPRFTHPAPDNIIKQIEDSIDKTGKARKPKLNGIYLLPGITWLWNMDAKSCAYWWANVANNRTPSNMKISPLTIVLDIFQSPYRKYKLPIFTETSTVYKIASQIYTNKDFTAMPILADALQEAGISNRAIINHCMKYKQHFKGCWVLDAILGKK